MLMDMACTSILTDTATINRVLMVYGLVSTLSTHTTASILTDLQNIDIVKNEFIVGLKPSTHSTSLVEELSHLVKQTDPHAVIIHTYFIGTFTGFAFKGNIKASSALRRHTSVDAVTPNVQLTLEDSPNDVVIKRVDKDSGLPYNAWGLARICSTKQLRGNGEMRYKFEARSGEGIYAYIIDTVVDVNHTEFEGRATFGINAVNESTTFPVDLLRHENMEHGTHVAGIVASKTYGVAKKTNVISVNVAQWDDAQNRSMVELDDVMEALEWVRNQHEKRKSKDKRAKSVINISLGYGLDVNFEKSLNAVVDSGITVVVAVGNNGKDACESFTSISNSKVISVACSDISDQFCTFSNYGKCVDIIAPGLQIPSTLPGNKIGVKNGTSMSAPHVTGVIARYLANDDLSSLPEQVKNWLLGSSLKNQIHFGDKENLGTPNRLVYMRPDEGHHSTADPTIAIVLVVLIVVFIVGMVTCTALKRMNMMPCAKKSDYSIF